MGAKIIWKIIAPNPGWVQVALWRKYFRGTRLRCLEQPKNDLITPLSLFINRIGPLISNYAYWIPGNVKRIQLWTDSILGRPPLAEVRAMSELKHWTSEQNINTPWDVSTWKDDA